MHVCYVEVFCKITILIISELHSEIIPHCITLNKTIMGKKAEQAEKIAKSVVKVAGIVATVGGVILKTVADNKK